MNLQCRETRVRCRVETKLCIGLQGIKKIKKLSLSDFSYGECIIYVNNSPFYLLVTTGASFHSSGLKQLLDEDVNNKTYSDKMVALLKRSGVRRSALSPHCGILSINIGSSKIEEYTLQEIMDIEE